MHAFLKPSELGKCNVAYATNWKIWKKLSNMKTLTFVPYIWSMRQKNSETRIFRELFHHLAHKVQTQKYDLSWKIDHLTPWAVIILEAIIWVAIIRVAIIRVANIRVAAIRVAIVLGGNYLGGNCPGWQLSWGVIIWGQ